MTVRYRLRGDVTKADLRELQRLLAALWVAKHEAKGERERYTATRRHDALKAVLDFFIPEAERVE